MSAAVPALIDAPDPRDRVIGGPGGTPLAISALPSPNHGERLPAGVPVDMLILHYTGMKTAGGALGWLCDARSEVSCHYFVEEDGTVLQLVAESRRAWHAGRSFWAGETDTNSRSIGIEIVNPGHRFGYRAFPEAQIASVIALGHDILSRHSIPPERVLAHSDIAPGRKEDPGELFPWQALAEAGIGRWVPPAPIVAGEALSVGDYGAPVRRLQHGLAAYGYAIGTHGVFDLATETVVVAFQRHFRPARIDGRADHSTRATLADLLVASGLEPSATSE